MPRFVTFYEGKYFESDSYEDLIKQLGEYKKSLQSEFVTQVSTTIQESTPEQEKPANQPEVKVESEPETKPAKRKKVEVKDERSSSQEEDRSA